MLELFDKVQGLEVQIARHDERLDAVEDYQKKQNGSLQRIEAKIDRFTWWLVLTLGGVVTSLVIILYKQ